MISVPHASRPARASPATLAPGRRAADRRAALERPALAPRRAACATWNGSCAACATTGLDRFDVLPISLATDGADRRARQSTVGGCGRTSSSAGWRAWRSASWPGSSVRVGEAVLQVVKLRSRCVMTIFDPDTLEQDHGVLRRIVEEFDERMALDCAVLEPGRISVGDARRAPRRRNGPAW